MEVSTTGVNLTGSPTVNAVAIANATQVAAKQDTLVSGTNIKTINGTSLLGSGNIPVVASPSGVSGAIQFSDGSAFASDATNFFWDNTNKRLGVRTNAPTSPFTLIGASQFGNAVGSGSIETFDGFYSMSFGKSTSIYNPNNNHTRIFMQSSQTFVDNTSGNFQFRSAGTTVMNLQSGNFAVGNGSDPILARTHIKGSGSTSATTSLLVQNSAGTELFKVRDDGAVNMASSFTAGNISTTFLNSGFFIFGNGLPRIYNVNALNANLSVNTTGIVASTSAYSTSTASAVLEATSTSQGFLPPRMTTTQKNAIATPAAGLVVYDSTTNKLCCYNGSTWNDLF
jgi:hypothetical protein